MVIPVIDLRRRFDLPPQSSPNRRIIILTIDGRTLGLIVDAVTEVVRAPKSAIRPAPGLLEEEAAPYFSGVCHHKGRTLILLNVKNVVASEEEIDVTSAAVALEEER
jgi:purine-binding chemotaxis protein CheW